MSFALHHVGETRHALLDVLQRFDHLGDALAGDVLERARLEDDHHLLVDQRLVGGPDRSRPRAISVSAHSMMVLVAASVACTMAPSSSPGGGYARVPEVVGLERADLGAHRLDVAGDLAQLAIDPGVHRLEEALQRLRRDFRQRG